MKRTKIEAKPYRSALKRVGKKGRAWNNERRRLKPIFARMGVARCEARLAGCTGDQNLSFAHCKKRRNLKRDELGKVALLCINCHDHFELQGEARMQPQLEQLIDERPERLLNDIF